jgi:hypothetical protein
MHYVLLTNIYTTMNAVLLKFTYSVTVTLIHLPLKISSDYYVQFVINPITRFSEAIDVYIGY